METLPNGVSITLSTKSKGIDQESELYMGYKNYTNLFKIPMWYEEKRVIDQLTIMLHRLTPYFETLKADGAVYDYLIVCDSSNNTQEIIDNQELRVAILVKPVRSAEYILCDFIATRTDANFSEII